jgi:cell division protein FtsI (penicillin-binding protein 3)
VTPSPFEHLISTGLKQIAHTTRMAFTGDVDPRHKAHKISSQQAHQRVKKRLQLALGFFAVVLSVITVRVGLLQTVQRGDYLAESIDQRTRVNIVRASRGVIFDRNGNELALSVPSTTVYADPREITDPVVTARQLAIHMALTPEEEARFVERFAKEGSKFVYIARGLTKDQAAILLNLNLPGIYSYIEPSRQVEGGVAEAVIGRTDPDGIGTSGLELQFNDMLAGFDGKVIKEVDNRGRSIAGQMTTAATPVPGDDLVLTIDKTVQYHADSALLDRVERVGAKGGTVIVMDSITGDIYAMSNVRRNAEGVAELARGNFAAVEAYEPGSVAKVFSVSAAMNEGEVNQETVLSVPGITVIDGFPIRDAWPHPTMDMSLRTIVSESSNIGTMLAAQKISSEKLHEYLTAFGFGQKSGLNYPGESRGILRPANKWRGTEKFTVSYGYGLATTALQIVAGVNTVANGGTYVAPRLVSATIDKSGKKIEAKPSVTRQVVSQETATEMTSMLREAVCTGTAELAQVKGMQVAGKTGTGYKAQDNGTYTTDAGARKYFASFVGYFPAQSPRITVFVSIDEPSASSRDRFGGTAAAPVFARLVPTIMREIGIEPTGTGTGCKRSVQSASR